MRLFRICASLILAIMVLFVTSCVKQEYDLNNLNTEMTIGSGGLAFPLGSTAKLTIKDLLNEENLKIFSKDESGAYSIKTGGYISMSDAIPSFFDESELANIFVLEDLSYKKDHLYSKSSIVIPPILGDQDYTIPDGILPDKTLDTYVYDVDLNVELPDVIARIEDVVLNENARVKVSITVKDPFITKGTVTPAIDIDLSEFLDINGGEPIHLSDLTLSEDNNYTNSKEYKVDGFNIDFPKLGSGEDMVKSTTISGKVSLTGAVTNRKAVEQSENMSLEISVSYLDFDITRVDAHIDYKVDPITKSVDLSSLPDFLKGDGVCLDIADPYAVVKLKTNMGVPVVGQLVMTPYRYGLPLPGTGLEMDVVLPYSDSHENMVESTLWLGSKGENVPEGAIFVEADLAGLIKAVPDSIVISLEGGTDVSRYCTIESGADYVMDLNYDFVVPIALGKDFRVEVSDTIDVMDAGIQNILKNNTIQLVGLVDNSFPFQFDLNVDLLDFDHKVIPTEDVKQTIESCAQNGSVSKSPLNLTLAAKEGADMTQLAFIRVAFVVSSGKSAGVPVTDDCYVQAKLAVNLPQGITLGLNEQ